MESPRIIGCGLRMHHTRTRQQKSKHRDNETELLHNLPIMSTQFPEDFLIPFKYTEAWNCTPVTCESDRKSSASFL